jgi:hypothetical protein
MWRFNDAELNCVRTKILRRSCVETVADGHVDEPVLAADRHRRFRSRLRERKQPRTLASAKDDRQNVIHKGF